jgi:hypothetical protein
MTEGAAENLDESRSPVVIPYAILGGLSVLALLGAVLALSAH